eukprot:3701746-Amphidinium_carterae.1
MQGRDALTWYTSCESMALQRRVWWNYELPCVSHYRSDRCFLSLVASDRACGPRVATTARCASSQP